MINLLPAERKEQYLYGRRNTVLRRWAFGLVFGLLGVALVATGGMLYLQSSVDSYSQQVIAANNSLKKQNLGDTQKHSQEITDSLKLVIKVLSREVLFSKLLTQIAAVTPANTSLSDLSISQVQGALELTAVSADYASATQLQVNLQDPANKIFSKADIQSINCNGKSSDPRYPCTVTIKALFSNNNPFLFINKGGSGS